MMKLKNVTTRIIPAAVVACALAVPFGAAQAWGGSGSYNNYYSSYPSYSSASASASAYASGGYSNASASASAASYASTPMYYGGYENGYSNNYGNNYNNYNAYTQPAPSYSPMNLCAYNSSQFECDYTYNITNNYSAPSQQHNSYSGWYGW